MFNLLSAFKSATRPVVVLNINY